MNLAIDSTFANMLGRFFGKVYIEDDFIDVITSALNRLGFTADNTIACVGVCRDEISQSLVESVNNRWHYSFNLSSLAGMFFAGKTGLLAAMHHAPDMDGKERYLFFALPHIAIDAKGNIGICSREGRKGSSTACGALNAFQKEIAGGKIDPALDFNDIELSLIKARLLKEITYGDVPDLLELTKIAQKVIQADLEVALERIVHKNSSDYAVITGIQIHGPDNNYVWPVTCYAVVAGTRHDIVFN